MTIPFLRRIRRGAAVAMAATGTAMLAVGPVMAQDEVRLDTELFGWDVEADATPVNVRFFDNFIPIPTDPGEPQFEVAASYTGANLGTGPNGRAVASSFWPGAALGDGFGTVAGDESQEYPIRAAARYPGSGEDEWSQQTTLEGTGAGMFAEARGLDVVARAEGGGLPAEAATLVTHGQVRSQSTARVVDGQAVARAVASIAEVRLLEGIIVLDNVVTDVTAQSDGETSATDGRTTIGGIEIMGMPVRLTDEGAVVQPPPPEDDEGEEEEPGPLQPVQDLLGPANDILQRLTDDLVADGVEETLGISIEALDHAEEVDGPLGERIASGVTITIDTAVLRAYLDPLLDVVPLGEILSAIPEDDEGNASRVKGLVFEVLGLGPTIEYVIGRGYVAASATPPFEMPDLDLPPPPPPPDTGATPPLDSSDAAPTDVTGPPTSGGTSGAPDVPAADVAPPESSSSPSVAPPSVAAGDGQGGPEPFGGIPVAAVGLSLLFGAIPTFGMRSVRDAAVGLTASTDVPRPLPDLRTGA